MAGRLPTSGGKLHEVMVSAREVTPESLSVSLHEANLNTSDRTSQRSMFPLLAWGLLSCWSGTKRRSSPSWLRTGAATCACSGRWFAGKTCQAVATSSWWTPA